MVVDCRFAFIVQQYIPEIESKHSCRNENQYQLWHFAHELNDSSLTFHAIVAKTFTKLIDDDEKYGHRIL